MSFSSSLHLRRLLAEFGRLEEGRLAPHRAPVLRHAPARLLLLLGHQELVGLVDKSGGEEGDKQDILNIWTKCTATTMHYVIAQKYQNS